MMMTSRGVGSRIQGRGALLRSLRALLQRVERFGAHRASTPQERRWSMALADALDGAFAQAIEDPGARASLQHATNRAELSRKAPARSSESSRV